MAVVNVWEGAATPSGFEVRAKVTGTTASLVVSQSSDLSSPVATVGPVTPDASTGLCVFTVTGLAASTRYYWGVKVDGTVDAAFPGTCKTFPVAGKPASFTIAAGVCAGDPNGATT